MGEKVLVFGGAYSSVAAVKSIIDYARKNNVSRIISTGDCIAYGCTHAQTVELLMGKVEVVSGNTDYAVGHSLATCNCGYEQGVCDMNALQWMKDAVEQLSAMQKKWLASLPQHISFQSGDKTCVVVHGSLSDDMEKSRTYMWKEVEWSKKHKDIEASSADIIIAGHTGVYYRQEQDGKEWINVGGVFSPWADVIIVEDGIASHQRIPYDVDQTVTSVTQRHNELQKRGQQHLDFMMYVHTFSTGIWSESMCTAVNMPQESKKDMLAYASTWKAC